MDEKSEGAKNEKEQKQNNVTRSLEESPSSNEQSKSVKKNRERQQRQRKQKEAQSLGAKKLGATKIEKLPDTETFEPDEIRKTISSEQPTISPPLKQECWEEHNEINLKEELKRIDEEELKKKSSSTEISEEPEELMSNLKFKEIFKPDGWEGLGEDVELPNDLSDDKYHPVLDKIVSQDEDFNGGWGGWGSWGMSSLINTATAGVSTLTSHVSQGLTLLEESMGIPDPEDLAESETAIEEKIKIEGMQIKSFKNNFFIFSQ